MRLGIDLIEIERIASARRRWGERFLERVFTAAERAACAGRCSSLASRFAAKEAAAKALGVGIGSIAWREVEVLTGEAGQPTLLLHGCAQAIAGRLGVTQACVSLSDTKDHAVAVVVLS